MVSEAVSVEMEDATPPKVDVAQLRVRHSAVVGHLLTKTMRIQKEMRGRKFRELQPALKDAVDALTEFQEEEWPPKPPPPVPEWMAEGEKPVLQDADFVTRSRTNTAEDHAESESINGLEAAEEEATTTTAAESTEGDDASETEPNTPTQPSPVVLGRLDVRAPTEEDPENGQPMHFAVATSLEAYSLVMSHPGKSTKACELALDCSTILIANRYVSGRAGGRDDESGSGPHVVKGEDTKEEPQSLVHRLMMVIGKCSESSTESIQTAVVKSLLALMTSPKCGIHEGSMLMAVRSTFHVYLIAKSEKCKAVAKTTLYDMLRTVFSRMEAYDAMLHSGTVTPSDDNSLKRVPSEPSLLSKEDLIAAANGDKLHSSATPGTATPSSLTAFASQFHTDGYLLFRALCRLSSKNLPDDGDNKVSARDSVNNLFSALYSQASLDPLALSSKILSLELILFVLKSAGSAFCKDEKFIYAVQHYLCVSLLKNCMSSNTRVAYLSQKIFLVLLHKFKAHLKSEIEVFVANIFLKVLDSPNSSFEQKALVLDALRTLCSDPTMLAQIFLNYDCDFDASNLYKEIVLHLTKLSGKSTATPSGTLSKKDAENELELSLAGTEVLLAILRAHLKALGLPVGDDDAESSASVRLRGILQLDVGLAAAPEHKPEPTQTNEPSFHGSVDDVSVASSKDVNGTPMSPSMPVGSNADAAGKIVDAFEMKRSAERNFELGTVKFTLSLKTGLKYFIENGFVELDADEVAVFFLTNKDKLDKTQVGEVLGREPDSAFVKDDGVDPEKGGRGFFVRVLHHYVDALDFTGLEFDDAIRLFLSGFRLPGEAQKIDRIMEKFAERYTLQNLEVFPSADTAFILGFSVIMLNTDLHNPNIKPEKRMTLESFIRNNRGISADGGDLPEEFLTGIFKRIQAEPFTLKEDDHARQKAAKEKAAKDLFDKSLFFEPSFFGTSSEDRKREKFKKEREELMTATEHLFRKRPGKDSSQRASQAASAQLSDTVSPADVVKPMFDVTWGPLIGTLSQVLECSDDERVIAACLGGFIYAVRIAAHSAMSLVRDTFVNSLAKFTYLGSVKEMKRKNVESIRTLLSIAVMDGEYLDESWAPVLQCISQLARLQLIASGLDSDEKFLVDRDAPPVQNVVADAGGLFRLPTKAETERETEEYNAGAVLEAVNEVLIDKVFTSTVNLSVRSIAHFIEQLVEVSAMEIAGDAKRGITGVGTSAKTHGRSRSESSAPKSSGHGEDGPRIFSLQKLVEVADYNMDVRPRIAWAQVWEIMAYHFTNVGCHHNPMVSIFVIDSLKQLSFKFLAKPELSDFNFQRKFLKPFLQILENKEAREEVRELILRCVDNMIRTLAHNIRSGWKIIFSILTLSASDSSERVSTLGLAILQRLLDEHLHQLCTLSNDKEIEAQETEFSPDMPAFEIRNRNANVEDFVGLCRASLSFIQTEESDSPLPIGLSMRALCHTACYADLIADHRVLPPMSGAQSSDPRVPGYTYAGLSEKEALEMVLWRPLLDGLAEGICSTAPSNTGGVGCLVQRGSLMALRAILLRHGDRFSTTEWTVILRQTILPAIQKAAESDRSTVVTIISESPTVTSVDFLSDTLPLPPPPDDEGLLMFATQSQSEESAPSRPLGQAELLVEASFADLRHRGDGNLSRAHVFLKKDIEGQLSPHDQPFPDSWVATTAPIVAGMLTDIASEIFIDKGVDGREILYPIIMEQLEQWCVGRPRVEKCEPWQPCEALVQVACREIGRFSRRLFDSLQCLSEEDAAAWTTSVCRWIAGTLSKSVAIEEATQEELVKAKLKVYGISTEEEPSEFPMNDSFDQGVEVVMDTPYGKGRMVGKRNDLFEFEDGRSMTVTMNMIALEFGATLYCPAQGSIMHHPAPKEEDVQEEEKEVSSEAEVSKEAEFIPKVGSMSRDTYWEMFVPALKVRCIAAHCLQQSLFAVMQSLVPLAGQDDISSLLESLNQSCVVSCKASNDEDLAHAFQEAMFSQWGDGVEEVEEALTNMGGFSHRSGSGMFFLTQEAGATKAIIHMLALLYCPVREDGDELLGWDREQFAEVFLLERMTDVLTKFLESEKSDGHLIDPNVWRNASESGGKVALYCTSFASVVVSILNIALELDTTKFARHKGEFFPMLCSLVRVHSDEIRNLVHDILVRQIGPMIGVTMEAE